MFQTESSFASPLNDGSEPGAAAALRGVRRGWRACRLAGAALLLGVVALPAQATINQVVFELSTDGTPGWDTSAGPGFDTGPSNRIVRTNDTFQYLITLSSTAAETNTYLTLTLPTGNVAPRVGQPVARWSYVPSQCEAGTSSISADGQTLVCHLPNIDSAGTASFYFNATVLGTTPNGTQIPAPSIGVVADSGPAPAPVALPPALTITAAPFYDVVIDMSYQGNPKAYAFFAGGGPAGEDGFYHRPLIGLVAKNPNGNGSKGVEQLDPGAPLLFTVDISGYPAGVLVDNWHTGTAPHGTPAATGSFQDGCGSPGLGAPSHESGEYVNMFTKVQDSGPTPNTAASVVPNGGDCAVTGSTATSVNLSVTGTDTTLARRPTIVSGTSAPIPATDWWVMNKALVLWTPITSYPPYTPIPHTIQLGSFTATSISGQPATGDDPSNNAHDYPMQTLDTGSASKLYSADSTRPAPYATICDPGVVGNCHVNYMASQQTVASSVRYANSGTTTQSNIEVCEVIDRTAFDIGSNFTAGLSGAVGTIQYGARPVGLSPYFPDTDASSNPYDNGIVGSSAYSQATCSDAGIQWFASAAEAEAAGGLVYVRADVPSMVGNTSANLVVRGLTLRLTYAATINVLSPVAGTRVAGQPISEGTLLRNRGHVRVNNGARQYQLRDHLLVVPMKTTSRVVKSIIAPITDPAAPLPVGSTVTYRLQPRYSTTFPPQPHAFTVTDVLPPGLAYVSGSATVGGVAEEPVVSVNTPAAGHTQLVWTATRTPHVGADGQPGSLMPVIEFQAAVSQTIADGVTLANAVAVSGGPADYAADCTYDPALQSFGNCVKSALLNVTVQTPPGFRISKSSSTPIIEPGQPFQYSINYASFGQAMTQLDIPDLIDILPFVGDGSGNPANNFDGRTPASQFNGNAFALVQVDVPASDPGMQVYYTVRPHAQINNDPRDPSNAAGGATVWCLASQFGTAGCPAAIGDATAVRLHPSLPELAANELYSVGLTLDTTHGVTGGGDVFQNSVGARSTNPASSLLYVQTQSEVPVRVVTASIAGTVFVDDNQNGVLEAPADVPLENVCVALTGTSSSGIAVALSMLTAADGTFLFEVGQVNRVYPSADCSGTPIVRFTGLNSGTYVLTQPVQPAGYVDGIEHAGSAGGTVGSDTITAIVLGQGVAATDYHFTEQAASMVSVRKELTLEDGSVPGIAEAGETLTYTLTVTNARGAPAANHAFYEVLPANTTLVSLSGGTIDCAVGTVGAALCTITVPGPIPGGGGSVQLEMVVQVVDPIPTGVMAITNLVTDDTGTVPPGCTASNQPCQTPPVCDPATDPQHCVVTPVSNDPPVAVDDSDTGVVGQPVTVPILGNDSDPNNNIDPTTVVIVNPPAGSTLSPDGKTLVVPGEGTWTVDPVTGAITFTPEPGFTDDPTPIQYTVTDTTGLVSNPATVTIDYQQNPPVAVDDAGEADDIGQVVTLPIVGNDSDADADLAPGTVNFDPGSVPGGVGTDTDGDGDIDQVVVPGEGTWTVDALGNATFTPQAGFIGNPTPILYAISDQTGLVSNQARITITYPQPSTALLVEKRGSRSQAEIGDTVQYTISVRNVGTTTAVNPVVVDRLPAGFRIIDGSSRVQGATLLASDGLPGPVVRLHLDRIAPDGVVSVTYLVRVGVGAAEGDGTNRASAQCPATGGNAACSNEASWRVRVTRGVFAEEACLVGKVFVDCNGNSVQDAGELGIPGVRMYLEDGTYLISDVEGKYSYCGLTPQTHVLKVDGSTLPAGSILTTSSSRNAGDANSIFVDAKRGELVRADFIEGSCQVPVLDAVKARRENGEVRTIRSDPPEAAQQFESRPASQPPRP